MNSTVTRMRMKKHRPQVKTKKPSGDEPMDMVIRVSATLSHFRQINELFELINMWWLYWYRRAQGWASYADRLTHLQECYQLQGEVLANNWRILCWIAWGFPRAVWKTWQWEYWPFPERAELSGLWCLFCVFVGGGCFLFGCFCCETGHTYNHTRGEQPNVLAFLFRFRDLSIDTYPCDAFGDRKKSKRRRQNSLWWLVSCL